MIYKHKDKGKNNNFGYLSTKFWLKGNGKLHNQRFSMCTDF